jgi:hypothetical protein
MAQPVSGRIWVAPGEIENVIESARLYLPTGDSHSANKTAPERGLFYWRNEIGERTFVRQRDAPPKAAKWSDPCQPPSEAVVIRSIARCQGKPHTTKRIPRRLAVSRYQLTAWRRATFRLRHLQQWHRRGRHLLTRNKPLCPCKPTASCHHRG